MTLPPPREIAIGLGSNLGNRLDNLRRARATLAQSPRVRLTATAPVYETQPIDVPPEFVHRRFLNTILLMETALEPERALDMLLRIEQRLGRDRTREPPHGPRLIDLDLIYAGAIIMHRPHLRLPHPQWAQRAFVLRPLADLRPTLILPGETRTVRKILAECSEQGIRRFADGPWWLEAGVD